MSTSVSNVNLANLKWSLENWREVAILADRVLSWEQDFYPGIIGGVVTLFYLMVWYLDPTFLTFLAFAGFLVTLGDYLGPKVVKQVFGSDSWNGAKEKHFELVCTKIGSVFDCLSTSVNNLREFRSSKPAAHFIATLIGLFMMAWIGNKINNFFMAYLVTLFVSLLPGLLERGLIQKQWAMVTLKIAELYKSKEFHKKAE